MFALVRNTITMKVNRILQGYVLEVYCIFFRQIMDFKYFIEEEPYIVSGEKYFWLWVIF